MMIDAPRRDAGVPASVPPAPGPHHVLLSLFVLIWGSNFVLAEVALREMAPISFSVARFGMGGIALLGLLYARCYILNRPEDRDLRIFPKVRPGDWPLLVLVSLLGATLAPWLGIEGLGLTHGARASLWLALGPALSCVIGYLLRTERIGKFGVLGIVLAGMGTLALAIDGIQPGRNFWLGDLLLFGALMLAVTELHLIKPLAARYGAISIVAVRTTIGGLIYIAIASPSLAGETWLGLSTWTWIAILIGGGVGVGLGHWIKVRALKTLGPTRVVLYGNVVPVAALLIAWLAIGTMPSVLELLAAFLIIAGVISLQVLDVTRKPAHSTEVAPETM